MGDGFDLREEPWIPVRLNGASVLVGLREVFHRAHEIEDLELPVPPAASGLLRILAAMTVRIAKDDVGHLDDEELVEDQGPTGWFRLRNRILAQGRFDAKAVDAYFDAKDMEGRFDLFDPKRPFLQDPRLRDECVDAKGKPNPSGVNKLVLGRPTGVNGAVLFGHFTDTAPVPVPAAEAAWHLIAQLYYGPSGQCTPRRITPEKPGNGDAGPLRKTVSFHPWGDRLFTTLVLAIPAPGEEQESGQPDRSPWEENELPDPLGPLPSPTWPARLLTGRFRHSVLLVPSADRRMVTDAYLTWSTHEPPHPVSDPYVISDMPRKGGSPYPRPADGRRALWRDLDALLLRTSDHEAQRPRILERLPRRLPDLRVRAYGFDQDGQQRDNGWYEATTPPVLRWRQEVDEAMAHYVNRCHRAAEDVGDKLNYAARLAWKLTTEPPKDPAAKVKLDSKKPGPWADAALRQFWPSAERAFWSLVTPERCDTPPHRPFVEAALDALDGAIGTTTRADVRVARARARARAVLFSVLPPPPGTEGPYPCEESA